MSTNFVYDTGSSPKTTSKSGGASAMAGEFGVDMSGAPVIGSKTKEKNLVLILELMIHQLFQMILL